MIQLSRKVIVSKIVPIMGVVDPRDAELIGKTGIIKYNNGRFQNLFPFVVQFDDARIPSDIFREEELENI